MKETWLSLVDYSTKYKVSISTLRRRIKAGKVEYSLDDGKYYLKDIPLNAQKEHIQTKPKKVVKAPPQKDSDHSNSADQDMTKEIQASQPSGVSESSMTGAGPAANELLGELKKAYSIILQEKEEQIMQLKDEVVDLRTLVRVLEEQNAELKAKRDEAATSSSEAWFDSIEKF